MGLGWLLDLSSMRWEQLEAPLRGACHACGPLLASCDGLWRLSFGGERPTALPPVRPPRADAFHQSWPQPMERKASKRHVASALGRERPKLELKPVIPPKRPSEKRAFR